MTCDEYTVNPNGSQRAMLVLPQTHCVILQHDFHDPTTEKHPQKQMVTIGIEVQVIEIYSPV